MWNYSPAACTHTVPSQIHRLRDYEEGETTWRPMRQPLSVKTSTSHGSDAHTQPV
jgi:hypothetical protein